MLSKSTLPDGTRATQWSTAERLHGTSWHELEGCYLPCLCACSILCARRISFGLPDQEVACTKLQARQTCLVDTHPLTLVAGLSMQ